MIYLAHHGIKGQKWGIRRFQNPDGSLTEEGLRRYDKKISEFDSGIRNLKTKYKAAKASKNKNLKKSLKSEIKRLKKRKNDFMYDVEDKMFSKAGEQIYNKDWRMRHRSTRMLKTAGSVIGGAAAVYGAKTLLKAHGVSGKSFTSRALLGGLGALSVSRVASNVSKNIMVNDYLRDRKSRKVDSKDMKNAFR